MKKVKDKKGVKHKHKYEQAVWPLLVSKKDSLVPEECSCGAKRWRKLKKGDTFRLDLSYYPTIKK